MRCIQSARSSTEVCDQLSNAARAAATAFVGIGEGSTLQERGTSSTGMQKTIHAFAKWSRA
jgi:hypothetical protein